MTEEIEALEGGGKHGTAGLMLVTVSALIMAVAVTVLGYITQFAGDKIVLTDLTEFLGNLHPVVLHLPIGIFVLVLAMELTGLLSFDKWRPQTSFPMFVGVVSAVVATIFGCLLFRQGDRSLDEAIWHMWGSIAFTVVGTLAFLAKIWADHSGSKSPIYGILLVVTMGLLGWSAHGGGEMTHGDPFGPYISKVFGTGPEKPDTLPVVAKAPEDRLVYEEIIVPILHGKCYECHADADKNPSGKKKIKGKFVMTDMESLKKGGSSDEPGITPGDLENSYIHYAIHLPVDEDEHMPPEDKDQLGAHEIAIIDWWITSGAPVGTTLKENNPPAEILQGVAKLVPPEELLAKQAAAAEAAAKAQAAAEAKRAELGKAIDEVGKSFPNALRYVSQDSSDLTFTAVSMRKDFGDEGVEKLLPVGNAIVELEIGATSVTDSGVAHLASMPHLQRVKLNETAVTDAALDTISKLPELEYLNLVSTAVTDEGLKKLEGLSKLRKLYLWQSKATKEGADALKAKLPECEINLGLD
ncbi:MAG: hypothetical protein O3A92_05990 [Verrucomicrobia bacterium]|nr:hypothetical protein [Verrucomicrobiota bacterium]